jgi:serine/threonine-protein kinase
VRRPGARSDPFVGRVIRSRYRVERQLGEGGMGAVYLAEQLSIGRKVALKILRGDFARDDTFVARFRQEAKLVAVLNETHNPHVTYVHDFDHADDGNVFIVMEWLEGRPLNEVIRAQAPLALPRVRRLALQIAQGLEAAHRAGVIHRDIKPHNIMVLDANDSIKLMDFGIARLRDSSQTPLTRAGTMMGTPDYMAPEQIEGQDVTDKTDVYSFGIVVYEMLTGVVPFRASTPAAVLTKQLREEPTGPHSPGARRPHLHRHA